MSCHFRTQNTATTPTRMELETSDDRPAWVDHEDVDQDLAVLALIIEREGTAETVKANQIQNAVRQRQQHRYRASIDAEHTWVIGQRAAALEPAPHPIAVEPTPGIVRSIGQRTPRWEIIAAMYSAPTITNTPLDQMLATAVRSIIGNNVIEHLTDWEAGTLSPDLTRALFAPWGTPIGRSARDLLHLALPEPDTLQRVADTLIHLDRTGRHSGRARLALDAAITEATASNMTSRHPITPAMQRVSLLSLTM